jgi:hypothetical protein
MVSVGRMIDELLIGKDLEGSGCGLIEISTTDIRIEYILYVWSFPLGFPTRALGIESYLYCDVQQQLEQFEV